MFDISQPNFQSSIIKSFLHFPGIDFDFSVVIPSNYTFPEKKITCWDYLFNIRPKKKRVCLMFPARLIFAARFQLPKCLIWTLFSFFFSIKFPKFLPFFLECASTIENSFLHYPRPSPSTSYLNIKGSIGLFKGTNGRQKTYEIFHVYCIFYSGFMC